MEKLTNPNHFRTSLKVINRHAQKQFFKQLIGSLAIVTLLIFIINSIVIYFVTDNFRDDYQIGRKKFIIRSFIYLYPLVYIIIIIQAFKTEHNATEKYNVSLWYDLIVVVYNVFWVVQKTINIVEIRNSIVLSTVVAWKWEQIWYAIAIFVSILTYFIIINQVLFLLISFKKSVPNQTDNKQIHQSEFLKTDAQKTPSDHH